MSGFRDAVEAILSRGGVKGYNSALREICRDIPHGLGEIIYKAVRYHAKHDPQDLVKIAAWAKLEWDYAYERGRGTGMQTGEGQVRGTDQGPRPSRAGARQGDLGVDSRGSGRNPVAEAVRAKAIVDAAAASRTGTGGRGRKLVGSKH